jgi:mevalonate kinase
MERAFPGKILLFGEYTIIIESKALVLPFKRFSGRLEMPENRHGSHPSDPPAKDLEDVHPVAGVVGSLSGSGILKSNEDLRKILKYLEKQQDRGSLLEDLDLSKLREMIEGGLYFNSTIPRGYGVGSSGALVAAIFDAFATAGIKKIAGDLARLRSILGQMESFYHGTSSGIDPLCSYLDRPVLLEGDSIRMVKVPHAKAGSGFFLLDTGQPGVTGPLVDYFKSRIQDPRFLEMIHDEMIPLVEKCIDLFLESDPGLAENLVMLSEIQYARFQKMIQQAIHKTWLHGLKSGLYSLKLCGSGGGGYVLGHTMQWEESKEYFRSSGIQLISLTG